MDKAYDKSTAKAGDIVEALVKAKVTKVDEGINLAERNFPDKFKVKQAGEPECLRLVDGRGTEGGIYEAVLRAQGVVVKLGVRSVLRPVQKGDIRHLQQNVTLCGLSCESFDQILQNIAFIDRKLSREFVAKDWVSWEPNIYEEHRSFEVSNRLLTPSWQCKSSTSEPIPENVDPRGVLQGLVEKGEVKYLKDNEVKFYHHKDGKYRKAGPTHFREGDIVEVQLSFCVIPTREKKHRMKIALRSIALEDDSQTQAADHKRMLERELDNKRKRSSSDAGESGRRKPTLIRQTGYGDEEEEEDIQEASSQLNDMDLTG
ncbi:hypothetical protein DFH11DRAFT_1548161 [Phellopilus nigrolimitatus]|nr:hypothetical protein DFH11DRAFT_1548161 [Phellopilus nigrolimitatus]